MDDLEFVRRCINKDKEAWDEFVKRYSRLIYNYVLAVMRLKGKDSFATDQINDLVQEILLLLFEDNFKKLKTFKAKNNCSLASWLRQVTINHSIDYLRKLKPVISIEAENEDGLNLKDALVDKSTSAQDSLIAAENILHLDECIERLDTEEKLLLELNIYRKISLEELKDYFKLTRGNIDMRKSRIIDKLKDCFKSKGVDLA